MKKIQTQQELSFWLQEQEKMPVAFQKLDLFAVSDQLYSVQSFDDCLFLGCDMARELAGDIVNRGGVVIPKDDDFEFEVHRAKLYTRSDLFDGFDIHDPNAYELTKDWLIYRQYCEQGRDNPSSIKVSLLRRLHDHSITSALRDVIAGKKVVAIMGGHSMERQDPIYSKIARISRRLTLSGFLMVSGGGPGAMEATNLGAYFASRSEEELQKAIECLSVRPAGAAAGKEYQDSDWLHRAFQVIEQFPPIEESKYISIGIPTWLYGHEPPTPFATYIAKYFANSVREEGLLAIAKHGVIFAPGSAGTIQEIFQDACQNHYGSMGVISPMILMGEDYWTKEKPVWDLLQKVSKGRRYSELLALTDDEESVVRRIRSFQDELYIA